MVRFWFSDNLTVSNSSFHPIGFPSCRNSIFRLPHRIISPYCTVAHGPVTSVAFILTPIFILRPTWNSALNAEHCYSYFLLLMSSSVICRTIQNYEVLNQIAFFYQKLKKKQTEPILQVFLGTEPTDSSVKVSFTDA